MVNIVLSFVCSGDKCGLKMILKIMMRMNHGKLKCPPPRSFGACQRRYHFAVDGQHGSTSSTLSSTSSSSSAAPTSWTPSKYWNQGMRWKMNTHRLNSGLPRLRGVMYLATIRGAGEAKNCPEWSLNLREGRVQGRKKWDSGLKPVFTLSHVQVWFTLWGWWLKPSCFSCFLLIIW